MSLRRMTTVFVSAALLLAAAVAFAATAGSISGVVANEDGNGIAGVTVTVTAAQDSHFKLVLTTDAAGHYAGQVEDTKYTYLIHAEKEGFSPSQTQVQAFSKNTAQADLTLHPPLPGSTPPPPKVPPGILAYNDGVALLQKGDKGAAYARFQEAVKDKPDLVQAWKVMSQIDYENKNYGAALTEGKKALDLDPKNTDLYGILMDSAQKTGDTADYNHYQQLYYQANANDPDVNYNAGVAAYTAKDYNGASGYFNKAIGLKPDMANAYFWLAMSQYNLKNYGDCRTNLRKYLKLDPNGAQAATSRQLLASLPG